MRLDLKNPEVELGRIRFFGKPDGLEREVVSDAIKILRGEKELDEEIEKHGERIKRLVAEFNVFVSPFCHHCAELARKLVQMAALGEGIRVDIIDITQFEDLQRKLEIFSVPTLIVNGRIRFQGGIGVEELLEIAEGDEEFIYNFLLKRIREGKAGELLHTLSNADSKLLAKLLQEEDIFVRLGVMYLLELIAEKDLRLEIIPELIKLLKKADKRTKEDIIMAISKIGGIKEIKALEKIYEKDKDLEDAVNDAIEEIKERLKSRGRKG
jgi:thiol-disulfide isomerase/thioredoxin